MRLLVTAHTGPSHLRALVPLAQLAGQRGHEVIVASSPSMRASAEAAGLQFRAVGADWSSYADLDAELGMLMLRQDLDGFIQLMLQRYHFGEPALEGAQDLVDLIGELKPAVVVREGEDIAGYLAAEARGIPHVTVASGNTHDLGAQQWVPELNRMRAALGMPAEPAGGGLYRYLLASFLPPRYYGDRFDGSELRSYRASSPADTAEALPDWFGALDPAKPLVLASLGTVAPTQHSMAEGALIDIIRALGRIDCEAIVSVGVGRGFANLPEAPNHVRLVDHWLPQPLILDTADLFVTHAGLGSVREAVRAGVPVVAVPQWDDQIYQGNRCAALGIGRVVHRRKRRPGEEGVVEAACQEVLTEAKFSRAARAVQRDLLAARPLSALVDDIEHLTQTP